MYIFVRFAAIVTVIFGVLTMVAGLGSSLIGYVQNESVTGLINQAFFAGQNIRLINAGYAVTVLGLLVFLFGMLISAVGQLMLVFVDVSNNTRETNVLLRALRKN